MKLLKLSNINHQCIADLERKIDAIESTDYPQKLKTVHEQYIDFSNFYQLNLHKNNYCEAIECIVNIPQLRKSWYAWKSKEARETPLQFALDVIEDSRPEIIFDHAQVLDGHVNDLKKKYPSIKLICTWDCWISRPADAGLDYDLYFTCLPLIAERYRNMGKKCMFNPFGFEPLLLDKIRSNNPPINKVCFIGSIASNQHNYRNEILNALRKADQLDWWIGNIGQGLFTRSKVRELLYGNFKGFLQNFPFELRNHGKLFGIDMYRAMASYAITLNVHGDGIAQIGNMRLTEAAGTGTCQLIDWKENAKEYFEPDAEAVFFKNTSELLEKTSYLISHPEKAKEIGLAGQQKVLKHFTFEQHVNRFWEAVKSAL